MAQDGILTPFGIADAKISVLVSDNAGGVSYGTALDLPGVQSVSFNPDFIEKELMGDDRVLDQYTKLKSISGSVKHGKVSLDVLAALMGGTNSDSGSSPNEVRTYELKDTDLPNYFKLEGQIAYKGGDDTVGGDAHLVFTKMKITKFSQEYQGEDYATVSFDFKAIARTHDGVIFQFIENETAQALSAGAADTTAPTCTTSPADAASGVAVSTSVVATFSENLQASSVSTSTAFLIKNDGTAVAATVTLTNAGSSTAVTINPDSNLSASTDYIAIFTTGIRDVAGNQMAANKVVNFQTA